MTLQALEQSLGLPAHPESPTPKPGRQAAFVYGLSELQLTQQPEMPFAELVRLLATGMQINAAEVQRRYPRLAWVYQRTLQVMRRTMSLNLYSIPRMFDLPEDQAHEFQEEMRAKIHAITRILASDTNVDGAVVDPKCSPLV